jgi:hypothetical protein
MACLDTSVEGLLGIVNPQGRIMAAPLWPRREGLPNPGFAQALLKWRLSGFSLNSGTRIYEVECATEGILQGHGASILLPSAGNRATG